MKKLLASLFAVFFSTALYASPVSNIIYFGDSLTDNGNLYAVTKNTPISPPYCQGRFSNGATWAEVLGGFYAIQRGYKIQNYAVGGAITMPHDKDYFSFTAPATLENEVYFYLVKNIFQDRSTVLFSIWIGANDYLFDTTPDQGENLDKLVAKVIDNIATNMDTLYKQNGRHFMVLNLPDLSRSPFVVSHGLTLRIKTLITKHNALLAEAMSNWQIKHPGSVVKIVDAHHFLEDVIKNTATYNQTYQTNITNLTDSCWPGGMNATGPIPFKALSAIGNISTPALCPSVAGVSVNNYQVCATPDQYLFWDEMHPTQVMHKILANLVYQDLQSHPELLA